jgi:hypothetical protein
VERGRGLRTSRICGSTSRGSRIRTCAIAADGAASQLQIPEEKRNAETTRRRSNQKEPGLFDQGGVKTWRLLGVRCSVARIGGLLAAALFPWPPRFLAMSNRLGRETGPILLEDAMWDRARDMNQRRRWICADCIHIDVSC